MTKEKYLSLTKKKNGTPIGINTPVEGFVVEENCLTFEKSSLEICRYTKEKGSRRLKVELVGNLSFPTVINEKQLDKFDKEVKTIIGNYYISKGKKTWTSKYYIRDNIFGYIFNDYKEFNEDII